MTSFTPLPNTAVQAGGRPRGSTITALRDNPLAIAEGDSTAPVNQAMWHPYNKVTVGDANTGRFYNFATDGVVANAVSPDFVDGYEYRIRGYALSHNSGAGAAIRVELFRETGGVYSAAYDMATGINSLNWSFELYLPYVRQSVQSQPVIGWIDADFANAFTGATTLNMHLGLSTAEKITRARISFSAGNIDAGQLFLDRRRVVF